MPRALLTEVLSVVLNMPTMPQPEAYIGGLDRLVDESGRFRDESTREFLAGFMGAFERWILRHVG